MPVALGEKRSTVRYGYSQSISVMDECAAAVTADIVILHNNTDVHTRKPGTATPSAAIRSVCATITVPFAAANPAQPSAA